MRPKRYCVHGIQFWSCKPCKNPYFREKMNESRQANPQKHREYGERFRRKHGMKQRRVGPDPEVRRRLKRDYRLRNAVWCRLLVAWLRELPCKECGVVTIDAHFHHRDPATKYTTVAWLAANGLKAKLMVEIIKCIILCTSCHRKHHAA